MFEESVWEGLNSDLKKKDGVDTKLTLNFSFNYDDPRLKKVMLYDTTSNSSGKKPQDADYDTIPTLSYELEVLIFARFPRSMYWKICSLNNKSRLLLKSGELRKIRKEIGVKEPSVFMLASGDNVWSSFDREFKCCRTLPILDTDMCFFAGDKESICAGTHLLLSGRELSGLVIWRYELETNQWCKGPSMINPRCLFASATCGDVAYIAGGIGSHRDSEVYNSTERYNSVTKKWDPLPKMIVRRKLCAGCYMDNKFYVIGGRNKNGGLTCGECFNEVENKWELIPDMLRDDPVQTCHAPPLIAVVNNELYSLEASSNQVKVYLKKSNEWKLLGRVPVRADSNRGWGVAFKSLGNELLVIGANIGAAAEASMAIYTCCPNPSDNELIWRPLDSGRNRLSHFILNCSVMLSDYT